MEGQQSRGAQVPQQAGEQQQRPGGTRPLWGTVHSTAATAQSTRLGPRETRTNQEGLVSYAEGTVMYPVLLYQSICG